MTTIGEFQRIQLNIKDCFTRVGANAHVTHLMFMFVLSARREERERWRERERETERETER